MNGVYSAKGFDEDDNDKTVLYLCLGGQNLVHAAAAIDGDASGRTARRNGSFISFKNMACVIDPDIIKYNMDKTVFSLPASKDICVAHLQIDDIKGQKNLRYDHAYNRLLGTCYHMKAHRSAEVRCWADIVDICEGIADGKFHLASEFTNVGIARNALEVYDTRIVACSAGCTSQDPEERQILLITEVIKAYVRDTRSDAHGILTTVQPDGAFAKITHRLFFTQDMPTSHRLYSQLSGLPLFALLVANDPDLENITAGSEMKHVAKCVKRRVKSAKGSKLGDGHITGPNLRVLLEATGLHTRFDLDSMFGTGFFDAMRVSPMVKLFRGICAISEMEPCAFGSRERMFTTLQTSLRLLAGICECYVTLIADNRPTLPAHLVNVSKLSHALLGLYRQHGTSFMPAQTYRNSQVLCQSIYWSVATCILFKVPYYFHILDAGDKLETFHCIERRTSNSGANFDYLQKQDRCGAAMTVGQLYAKHPNWKPPERHLNASEEAGHDDAQNPARFLHVRGSSPSRRDMSRIAVSGVSLRNCYMRGREEATKLLEEGKVPSEHFDWDQMVADGINFLRPTGSFVGVSVRDDEEEEAAETKLNTPSTVILTEEEQKERDGDAHHVSYLFEASVALT